MDLWKATSGSQLSSVLIQTLDNLVASWIYLRLGMFVKREKHMKNFKHFPSLSIFLFIYLSYKSLYSSLYISFSYIYLSFYISIFKYFSIYLFIVNYLYIIIFKWNLRTDIWYCKWVYLHTVLNFYYFSIFIIVWAFMLPVFVCLKVPTQIGKRKNISVHL